MKKQNQRFVFFLTALLMLVMACAVSAQESTDPDTGKTVQEDIVLRADGETISKTVEEPIESEGTAVSLSAVNQGSVTLTAQDIFGTQTGASIETESDGTAVLNSYSIASEAAGLSVYAESGKVNVHNDGFIDGYRAVSLINEGAEADIHAGELDSVVGVSITASGGTTKLESDDIYAEGYGVIVDGSTVVSPINMHLIPGKMKLMRILLTPSKPKPKRKTRRVISLRRPIPRVTGSKMTMISTGVMIIGMAAGMMKLTPTKVKIHRAVPPVFRSAQAEKAPLSRSKLTVMFPWDMAMKCNPKAKLL